MAEIIREATKQRMFVIHKLKHVQVAAGYLCIFHERKHLKQKQNEKDTSHIYTRITRDIRLQVDSQTRRNR